MNAFIHLIDYFGPPAPREPENWLQRHLRRQKNPLWRLHQRLHRWKTNIEIKVCSSLRFLWRISFGRWLYVKIRSHSRVEVASMRFITENTSIPVPKVWLHFQWKQLDYIVMQRMPGQCLDSIWPDLSDESKEIIVEQLARYVREMRSIPSPAGTQICSVLGGPIRNYRMYDDGNTGPFRDEAHLNLQLRCRHPVEETVPIVAVAHAKPHPLVFTHGDLMARNIMVQGTRVIAIIDWECAGWFPAHIEYCMAMNWQNWKLVHEPWRPWVHKFIPVYKVEAEADEALLSQYFVPMMHAP